MIIDIIRISWIMSKKSYRDKNKVINHMKLLIKQTTSNGGVILHRLSITTDNVLCCLVLGKHSEY